jgi:hypothetical protein
VAAQVAAGQNEGHYDAAAAAAAPPPSHRHRRHRTIPRWEASGPPKHKFMGGHVFVNWALHGALTRTHHFDGDEFVRRPGRQALQWVRKPLVLHLCNTPSCLNPLHLMKGTYPHNARARHTTEAHVGAVMLNVAPPSELNSLWGPNAVWRDLHLELTPPHFMR